MGFYDVRHDNKRFNDIILLEFVICQCSYNTWKCKQWFMKDLVQKFKVLVFIDHLPCLFNYRLFVIIKIIGITCDQIIIVPISSDDELKDIKWVFVFYIWFY